MPADLLHGQCTSTSVGTVNRMVRTLVQALLAAQCAISPPEYWPPDYGDRALQHGLEAYDFVVVGGGSAGSVVASRLSENPDWSVLVLEGGDDPPQESQVPSLFFTIQKTRYDWQYLTEASRGSCQAMRERRCFWPRGKMIGGTGGINAMLYIRGNRKDFDGWRDRGNAGWGWDDVVPYFEKSVRPAGNESHPQGYVMVNPFNRFNEDIQEMLYAGVAELGQRQVASFEDGVETGYSNLPGSVMHGERTSTGRGHLGKVGDRPNLHVIKNAHVTAIRFDPSGTRAESVEFVLRDRHPMTARVKKEAVVSAGTVDSAKLLLLSGIGPRSHLEAVGVPCVHDLRVGHNLQDHVMALMFFKIQEDVAAELPPTEPLDAIYNYLIHREGRLTATGTAPLTGLVNTLDGDDSPYPDIEYHHFFFNRGQTPGMLSFLKGANIDDRYKDRIMKVLERAHMLVVFTSLAHPKSRGRVSLRSSDYREPPVIETNYLEHPDDLATVVRGIRYLERLQNTTAFRDMDARLAHIFIEECDALQLAYGSDAYWHCYIKYFTSTVYHHTSSVKMGPASDGDACVDPRLRLRGVRNLRVIDASIMPDVTSTNTNAPTIMIAEKGADFIKEDWAVDSADYHHEF